MYCFESPLSLYVELITLLSEMGGITRGLPVPASPADPLDPAVSKACEAELVFVEKTVQKVKRKSRGRLLIFRVSACSYFPGTLFVETMVV